MPWRQSKMIVVNEVERRLSPDTLGFLAAITMRNKCLFFKPCSPWYFSESNQNWLREVVPQCGLNRYILDYLIFYLAIQILVAAHWIFNLLLVSASSFSFSMRTLSWGMWECWPGLNSGPLCWKHRAFVQGRSLLKNRSFKLWSGPVYWFFSFMIHDAIWDFKILFEVFFPPNQGDNSFIPCFLLESLTC